MTDEQRSDTEYILGVMAAFLNGKVIQWRDRFKGEREEWQDTDQPLWNWRGSEYRVKP
jgi:hypothetical protein